MQAKHRVLLVLVAALSSACLSPAQTAFRVDGKEVQVHGFASQGFVYSGNNNFLTMKTSAGSFAMTDGGVNMSAQVTGKLRVGAQMYLRNVGELGEWNPRLDWAYADYRFVSWFGVRAGKVKTVLGLYNDTQDVDFVQTFALLPQSVYPLDLRDNFIAHTGMDFYGVAPAIRKSTVRYTLYAGMRTDDPDGGYYFSTKTSGTPLANTGGNDIGLDVRWEGLLPGLTLGVSHMAQTLHLRGTAVILGGLPYRGWSRSPEEITSPYIDYAAGRWHFSTEFRSDKTIRDVAVMGHYFGSQDASNKGWYGTAAFRVRRWLELGTYHSRFYVDSPQGPDLSLIPDPNAKHIYDQAVTARFDFLKFWYAKVEGHFMDGYGDAYAAHGFYGASNPNGLKPKTRMFVVRTGVSF